MILLDTHAWVWWVSDPERLSRRARGAIDKAIPERKIHVSCISTWEIALLVARGRLELTLDIQEWVRKSEAIPCLNFIPVDNRIALKSVLLPAFHNDPADRILVATALTLGAALVTQDEKIQDYRHVRTIW